MKWCIRVVREVFPDMFRRVRRVVKPQDQPSVQRWLQNASAGPGTEPKFAFSSPIMTRRPTKNGSPQSNDDKSAAGAGPARSGSTASAELIASAFCTAKLIVVTEPFNPSI